jgi:hypothetical protein
VAGGGDVEAALAEIEVKSQEMINACLAAAVPLRGPS